MTAAVDSLEYFFHTVSEKIRQDIYMNPLLGMKHRALFSSKDNAKKIKFSLLQDSFGAYRKNSKYWDIYV